MNSLLSRRTMLVILSLATGCGSGDGLNRQAISGMVHLDGQPLGEGAILLEPSNPEAGPPVGAVIRRGAFAIARDQGPVPGTYQVRIYASSGAQPPPRKGQTEHTRRPMVERLPAVYNTRSVLSAKVAPRGPNHFRFELKTGDPE
jgi:hypothetical protein